MLTVAVCTWNRAQLLRRCLQQMTRLRPHPEFDWEVLVIDNNSNDGTDDVIEDFCGRLPLTGVREIQPGLSHARNTAIRHARGEYLLWTDDDVLVDEHWLFAHAQAIRRWPQAAIFGGPVLPRFEGTPPNWLLEGWGLVDVAFASRNLGPEPFALDGRSTNLPFGANYVVRTAEQRRFTYDPDLGRNQSSRLLLSGEETQVIKSILASGATGWWVPEATVEHWIPRDRQTMEYVRRYFDSRGRMNAGRSAPSAVARLLGRPRWAWRQAIVDEVRYRLLRHRLPAPEWVGAMIRASEAWGVLKGPP